MVRFGYQCILYQWIHSSFESMVGFLQRTKTGMYRKDNWCMGSYMFNNGHNLSIRLFHILFDFFFTMYTMHLAKYFDCRYIFFFKSRHTLILNLYVVHDIFFNLMPKDELNKKRTWDLSEWIKYKRDVEISYTAHQNKSAHHLSFCV